jgi:hypothetical protein
MQVKIGPTSIAGWGVAVLGFIPIIVKLLEEGVAASHLGGTEQASALIGLVIGAVTQLGRYAQSTILAKGEAMSQLSQEAKSQPAPTPKVGK